MDSINPPGIEYAVGLHKMTCINIVAKTYKPDSYSVIFGYAVNQRLTSFDVHLKRTRLTIIFNRTKHNLAILLELFLTNTFDFEKALGGRRSSAGHVSQSSVAKDYVSRNALFACNNCP